MFIRFLMAGLLLLSGMRGLQACIGEAGHFHFEVAHSHDDHCEGHSHPVEQTDSPQCDHSDDHLHVDLSIDEPINHSTQRLALNKGHPRVLVGFASVFSEQTFFSQVLQRPSVVFRRAEPSWRVAVSTVVMRL